MKVSDQLVNQHVKEYESRLRHIDELIERARQATDKLEDDHPHKQAVSECNEQRANLVKEVEQAESLRPDHWREDMIRLSGPLAVWDVLAQKLEDLIEKVE